MWPLWLVEMSLQHIQKNSPGLLPKPAKFEKNPPNGYRVIRKTKCGAGGAGSSPIHKQASLAGRLIRYLICDKTIGMSNTIIYASAKILHGCWCQKICTLCTSLMTQQRHAITNWKVRLQWVVKIHPGTRVTQIYVTFRYSHVLVCTLFPLHKQNSVFQKRCLCTESHVLSS